MYQNRIKVMGRRILAAVPGRENLVLKLYDIPLGKDVWSKNFDPRAIVLQTDDPSLAGVMDPDGKVTALDVETGRELTQASLVHGRITTEDLKGLKGPMLLRDAEHFFVALNKPIDPTKVAGGIVANNFQNGLRCSPVNGWFVALHRQAGSRTVGEKTISWKAGDFHWHSYTPLANQMIVLEQFEQLPILLFTARYSELMNGGANRWVSLTQSIDKRTGKMVFDPGARQSNSAPQFTGFSLDLQNGTINMTGFVGAIQHYIDDGRKPADLPGVQVGAAPAPSQSTEPFNPFGLVPGRNPQAPGMMRNLGLLPPQPAIRQDPNRGGAIIIIPQPKE